MLRQEDFYIGMQVVLDISKLKDGLTFCSNFGYAMNVPLDVEVTSTRTSKEYGYDCFIGVPNRKGYDWGVPAASLSIKNTRDWISQSLVRMYQGG